MCYYNEQKVTRAEFIQLKQLEKAVRDYDFLDKGVHNGFNYAPIAIIVPTDDRRDFEINRQSGGLFLVMPRIGKRRRSSGRYTQP